MRVAVVGAGISGVACARRLVDQGHEVVVLDRGKVPGGRMASRRFGDDRYVDTGASYFTVQDHAFAAVVSDWEGRGLARRWTDTFAVDDGTTKTGPLRWAGTRGLRALVADLAAPLDVRYLTHVEAAREGVVDGTAYDLVVLALPDPQALAILSGPSRAVVEGRAWEPVLVLSARWQRRCWDFADGVFVNGSDVLSWVADDGARRGDGAPVLTAHATPAFAATRLSVPADAAGELVAALGDLGVPAPDEVLRVQRWTYARPVGEREAMFHLGDGIAFCGDSWGSPRVETAWRSGDLLAQEIGQA